MMQQISTIGFVIVSHETGPKLQRLIEALDREYKNPPIAIHHDFSQAPIDQQCFRAGIVWVKDWERTQWAKWSVVEGAIKAFKLLYSNLDTHWFFLLSAADYPIRKGETVLAELADSPFDAYIDARCLNENVQVSEIDPSQFNAKLTHFASRTNVAMKRKFYYSPQFWLPIVRTKPRIRLGKWTFRPPFDGNHPFLNGVECHFGDHWFTANRNAIGALLDPSSLNHSLQRHYRNRTQPDESYYATLFANTPNLRINLNNRRFAEWNGGGAGPMTLTCAQLSEILNSQAFFARKMGDDDELCLLIDDAPSNL